MKRAAWTVNGQKNLRFLSSDLLGKCKKRAVKHSGAIVTIDWKWVHSRLERGVCEITGLKFDFNSFGTGKIHNLAPSIDRRDSSNKNYTPENSRIVCAQVNMALGAWNMNDSLPVLKALVHSIESTQRGGPRPHDDESHSEESNDYFRYT